MPFVMRFVIGIALVLLIDLYFYQAIALLIANLSPFKKVMLRNVYWGFTAYTILLLLIAMAIPFQEWWPFARIYLFAFAAVLIICKLIGSTFILVDDLSRLFRWLFNAVFTPAATNAHKVGSATRLKFLNQLAVVFAAIHAFISIYWFFGPLLLFLLFSYSYLIWRSHSYKYAFIAACVPHMLNNLVSVLLAKYL